ncbi:MAG: hypothetical protein EBR86_17725, partial [Planctomycetia bacterium]|nr:hypothetical protein [Planctomycetia bacterium]
MEIPAVVRVGEMFRRPGKGPPDNSKAAAMDTTFDGGHRGPARRGVLLLIVLSMLTLFMMLGTAYLVVATRAKETARAFSRLALQSDAR